MSTKTEPGTKQSTAHKFFMPNKAVFIWKTCLFGFGNFPQKLTVKFFNKKNGKTFFKYYFFIFFLTEKLFGLAIFCFWFALNFDPDKVVLVLATLGRTHNRKVNVQFLLVDNRGLKIVRLPVQKENVPGTP